MEKTFYSQFGEDQWIYENIIKESYGVFVDVGAGDPKKLSNSYFFEKLGWDVLCIDADHRQIEKLKKERKNVVGAVVYDSTPAYFKEERLDLSRICKTNEDKSTRIVTKTLENILKENSIGKIDILSIDVEGSEINVLKSFDIRKHSPEVMIIEFNTLGIVRDKEIKKYLSAWPEYKEVKRLGANLIFSKTMPTNNKQKEGNK